MANKEIRNKMKANKVYQWQIAEKLGVCEQTVLRMFRTPMNIEIKTKINNAIDDIILEREQEAAANE